MPVESGLVSPKPRYHRYLEANRTKSKKQQESYDSNGHLEDYIRAETRASEMPQRLHLAVLEYSEDYPDAVHGAAVAGISKYY